MHITHHADDREWACAPSCQMFRWTHANDFADWILVWEKLLDNRLVNDGDRGCLASVALGKIAAGAQWNAQRAKIIRSDLAITHRWNLIHRSRWRAPFDRQVFTPAAAGVRQARSGACGEDAGQLCDASCQVLIEG